MSKSSDPNPWSLEFLTPPWGDAPSLYLHIRDNPSQNDLPDEIKEPGAVRWAPGALDGVMGHHMGGGEAELNARCKKLMNALEVLLLLPTDDSLRARDETANAESLLSMADAFLKMLSETFRLSWQTQIAQVGRCFAAGAARREAVKFGILLLGMAGGSNDDLQLLRTLATHDEFTLFAAVALTRLVEDPEQALFEIAKKVHGWGRIQIVERLDGTENPEIQAWMLREGFRNSVRDNYLALICATSGRLHEALRAAIIDRELLDGAGGLMAGLLDMGPAPGMDDYEHAPQAIQSWLGHVACAGTLDLQHFLNVQAVSDFLHEDDTSWEPRFTRGWTRELRDKLRLHCRQLLRAEAWRPRMEEGLRSADPHQFYLAAEMARNLGIDTWAEHFAQVKAAPLTSNCWFRLMQQTDADRIDNVIPLVNNSLPLAEIASGPANDMGLGPGYEAHRVLDSVLQDLSRFPGRGWPLIRTGLQSPVVRNRNMAVRAFEAWERDTWPAEAQSVLATACEKEPDSKLRGNLRKLLQLQ